MSKFFIHIECSSHHGAMQGIEKDMYEYLMDTYQHRLVKDTVDVYEDVHEKAHELNRESPVFSGFWTIQYLGQHPPRVSIVWQATKRQVFHLIFYPVNE